MADILVYIEHDADGITDLSLQCLAKARQLAGCCGGKTVGAAVLGADAEKVAAEVIARGADVAFAVEDAALADYLPKPYAAALAQLLEQQPARLLILPASTVGNDVGPLLAGRLDAGCVVDCSDIACDGTVCTFKRLDFDAQAYTLYRNAGGGLAIVTCKDGIAEAAAAGAGGGEAVSVTVAIGAEEQSTTLDRREVARKTVNLKDAKVIIGGGAGVGNAANFQLLEQLASKLNAEIGATRAAVDAGWVSHERQIGQTGVTVRPDLYIAVGISGAVQHVVGIRDAKQIIAINNDPSAPIYKMAHYKIVGDLNSVVPKLVDLLS